MMINRLPMVQPIGAIKSEEKTETPSNGASFGKMLNRAIQDVNELQKNAQQSAVDLASGKVQDLSEVTIAMEKATIALQLTMQVRNKVVDAYQEMMRMQV